MREKITKRLVDSLPPPVEQDTWVWDTELAGFGLRYRLAGSKVYVLKYAVGRRQKWVTIGKHGAPWTPDEARKEARRLLGLVAIGEDPAVSRDRLKTAPTIRELAERFLEEHAVPHTKPATAKDYRANLNLHVLPAMGKLLVQEVTRAEVAKLHHSLRATPVQANRVLAALSKMFSLAEVWGYRPQNTNPCFRQARFKEQKRDRYLTPEELSRLGDLLRDREDHGAESPYVVAALRLLIFTGARLGEILGLRWEFVDLGNGLLRLPDSKTGAKTIPLNAPAVDVLMQLPRVLGNPHVIVGDKPGAHLVNLEKPWLRLRSQIGLEDVRLHDLRHTFASVGAASGLGLPVIGAVLGHAQAATTQRYAHVGNDPRKAASEQIAGQLDALMGRRKGSA